MTATILLIRHAAHGHLGNTLSGRRDGIPLSADGASQARSLAARLAARSPDAVQSSPVQRARETAEAIARSCSISMEVVDALDEIDFGDWTGRRFAELAGDPAWDQWNTRRSEAVPPGGESMVAAQQRAISHLRETASRYSGGTVAMVTHCDIIRAIVAGILGLSLDRVLGFDIDPAKVSRVAAGDWGARVMSLNEGVE